MPISRYSVDTLLYQKKVTIMEIIAYGTHHTIPEHWVERWQLLIDFREDNGDTMNWSYTPNAELRRWLRLNVIMDEVKQRREEYEAENEGSDVDQAPLEDIYQELILISSILTTLQYMNATSGEYLLNTRIDDKTPPLERKRLYTELGKWIRENDMRFIYRVQVREDEEYQTHANLGIGRDPATSTNKDDELFQLALKTPYNLLTGIIHTGYQNTGDDNVISAGEPWYATEAPWWHINWNDVRDFYFSNETEKQRDDVLDELDALMENEKNRQKKRHMTHFWEDLDKMQGSPQSMSKIVRIFSGLPAVDIVPLTTEGYFTFYPGIYRPLFDHPEELSLLLRPEYFHLLARQAIVSDKIADVAVLFGIDVLLVGKFAPYAGDAITVDASSVVSAWIKDSLGMHYTDGIIPSYDYEFIITSLMNESSRDFIQGIHTLLLRLRENTTLWRNNNGQPMWGSNAQLLIEAVEAVLAL